VGLVTTARNGQRPASQGRRPVPGASADYSMAVGGMVSCRRCAALLLDTRPARDQHDAFHAALRQLWDAVGARP
jgi:hypothetical protein